MAGYYVVLAELSAAYCVENELGERMLSNENLLVFLWVIIFLNKSF